jgi:hypothetical protein
LSCLAGSYGKQTAKKFAPKGTSSIHGRTKTDERFETNNIFRQQTLTKEGGCNGRNQATGYPAIGRAGPSRVVVFVHRKVEGRSNRMTP